MLRKFLIIVCSLMLLCACAPGENTTGSTGLPAESGTSEVGVMRSSQVNQTAAALETSLPPSPEVFQGLPLPTGQLPLFTASGTCTGCHSGQRDQAGEDVAIDSAWRASMLANASRDPYWLATVRSEVNQASALSAVIQKKCATCHLPMASVTVAAQGENVTIVDEGLLSTNHPLQAFAKDGISCNVCHQIESANFSQPESMSGGFLIDTKLPAGERLSYGPYEVSQDLAKMMQSVSGFIPVQGLHLSQSEMCATCHDLYTPYLDEKGEVAGEFPEQLIYSEWQNSSFNGQKSCADCHMPVVQGDIQLSLTGGPQRSPYNQHVFVGGNAYMLQVLQQNGENIGVTAAPGHFAAAISRTNDQIAKQSASLTIGSASLQDGWITADISIQNLVGHKFPGGYPSRRAWLHIRILDSAGQVVFESGQPQANGAIAGNDNDLDAAYYEPHYTELQTSDQVQIYEAIMFNSQDQVTTALLRAARFAKDNRLLPDGFMLDTEKAELLPQGAAAQDADFLAGSDTLLLNIDLGQATGPYTLQVELLYQSIAYRWAENLRTQPGVEIAAFNEYYISIPNQPLLAANAEVTVSP